MWLLSLKTVLVAVDFDDSSHAALRTAARLAELAGARLHLLHVSAEKTYADSVRLREHFRTVVPRGPEPAGAEVLTGLPAALIVDRAIVLDADAIVMGAHRRAKQVDGLGGTATRVVRSAPCPCLVVPAELRLPLQHVVAPIDLSPVARGALAVALSWASALRPRGGETTLTALHLTQQDAATDIEARVHEEVLHARTNAAGAASVLIEEKVVSAEPVEGILRAAADADLVVMGTRGASDVTAGLGSVSAAVAQANAGPLVLVPPATWLERGSMRTA